MPTAAPTKTLSIEPIAIQPITTASTSSTKALATKPLVIEWMVLASAATTTKLPAIEPVMVTSTVPTKTIPTERLAKEPIITGCMAPTAAWATQPSAMKLPFPAPSESVDIEPVIVTSTPSTKALSIATAATLHLEQCGELIAPSTLPTAAPTKTLSIESITIEPITAASTSPTKALATKSLVIEPMVIASAATTTALITELPAIEPVMVTSTVPAKAIITERLAKEPIITACTAPTAAWMTQPSALKLPFLAPSESVDIEPVIVTYTPSTTSSIATAATLDLNQCDELIAPSTLQTAAATKTLSIEPIAIEPITIASAAPTTALITELPGVEQIMVTSTVPTKAIITERLAKEPIITACTAPTEAWTTQPSAMKLPFTTPSESVDIEPVIVTSMPSSKASSIATAATLNLDECVTLVKDESKLEFSDNSDSEIGYNMSSTIVDILFVNQDPLCIDLDLIPERDSVCASPISESQSFLPLFLPEVTTPINDSGIVAEDSLEIIDTDDDGNNNHDRRSLEDNDEMDERKGDATAKTTDKKVCLKPARPCMFCKIPQTRLKRHILTKHKDELQVIPILTMNSKEQDRHITVFRKQGIRNQNMDMLKVGESCFTRERKASSKGSEIPIMCSGCKGFFSRSYKARHQLICPTAGSNLMVPMVSVASTQHLENFHSDFKDLLNTLILDVVGNYIKTDEIILMIGARSFGALKRKKDKVTETKKSVRSRMRLTARIYLCFREIYSKQSEVQLIEPLNNSGDMYSREAIIILGRAVNSISEKSSDDMNQTSISGQKSGLKVSILNLLKLTSKFLIGHFLVKGSDARAQKVTDFLQVLKLYEDDFFGDAYYDLQYRKNVNLRKPVNLPKDDDISMLMAECNNIMSSIDPYCYPSQSFIDIRSATATSIIIFCARRGGEPVRLQLYQWEEAVSGEWVDKEDMPDEFNMSTMLITFQTGKGSDHLVPVMFPPECIKAMRYLTSKEVRRDAGVHENNPYIFASTQNSQSHASGWHCINYILKRLCLKGAINATRNRHRVASILAKLQLSENEKHLIFKHFGHSERINETVYQTPAGSMQLNSTGQRLLQISSSHTLVAKNVSANLAQSSEMAVPKPVSCEEPKKSGTDQRICLKRNICKSVDVTNPKCGQHKMAEKTDNRKRKCLETNICKPVKHAVPKDAQHKVAVEARDKRKCSQRKAIHFEGKIKYVLKGK